MRNLFVPLILPLLAASPAAAQLPVAGELQSADAPHGATKPIPEDAIGVRVICIKNQTSLGSRIPAARVCHTEQEWAQLRANGATTFEAMRTRLNNTSPGH